MEEEGSGPHCFKGDPLSSPFRDLKPKPTVQFTSVPDFVATPSQVTHCPIQPHSYPDLERLALSVPFSPPPRAWDLRWGMMSVGL